MITKDTIQSLRDREKNVIRKAYIKRYNASIDDEPSHYLADQYDSDNDHCDILVDTGFLTRTETEDYDGTDYFYALSNEAFAAMLKLEIPTRPDDNQGRSLLLGRRYESDWLRDCDENPEDAVDYQAWLENQIASLNIALDKLQDVKDTSERAERECDRLERIRGRHDEGFRRVYDLIAKLRTITDSDGLKLLALVAEEVNKEVVRDEIPF